jgi:hypothetical protein
MHLWHGELEAIQALDFPTLKIKNLSTLCNIALDHIKVDELLLIILNSPFNQPASTVTIETRYLISSWNLF